MALKLGKFQSLQRASNPPIQITDEASLPTYVVDSLPHLLGFQKANILNHLFPTKVQSIGLVYFSDSNCIFWNLLELFRLF